jgi:hypothetical protein
VKRAALALVLAGVAVLPACGAGAREDVPFCLEQSKNDGLLILFAQAVPTATFVPCLSGLPAGWSFAGEDARSGRASFWLDSDRAGPSALIVTLTRSCDVRGAVLVPSAPDEAGLQRYERPSSLPPHYVATRFYVFPGGCVTYRFSFARGSSFGLAIEVSDAIEFFSRAEGAKLLAEHGFRLCGAGVTCPG